MGVPPSPPPRTVGSQKTNGKKLTERGGTPPPPRKVSVPGVFEPFPYKDNLWKNYITCNHCDKKVPGTTSQNYSVIHVYHGWYSSHFYWYVQELQANDSSILISSVNLVNEGNKCVNQERKPRFILRWCNTWKQGLGRNCWMVSIIWFVEVTNQI